jgi:hypothetical protein
MTSPDVPVRHYPSHAETKRTRGSDAPVPGKCGAKLRKSDPARYCTMNPITGRGRCKFHGGATPRGVAHPRYAGRAYSRDLPTKYADRMRNADEDTDLVSLKAELSLLDARMGELLGKTGSGEGPTAWKVVELTVHKLQHALDTKNGADAATAMDKLRDAMQNARSEAEAWGELYGVIELRRKTADAERRREADLQANLNYKQAQTLIGAIIGAVLDEAGEEISMRVGNRIALLLEGSKLSRIAGALPGEIVRRRGEDLIVDGDEDPTDAIDVSPDDE